LNSKQHPHKLLFKHPAYDVLTQEIFMEVHTKVPSTIPLTAAQTAAQSDKSKALQAALAQIEKQFG
jgi:hypothetical protein